MISQTFKQRKEKERFSFGLPFEFDFPFVASDLEEKDNKVEIYGKVRKNWCSMVLLENIYVGLSHITYSLTGASILKH